MTDQDTSTDADVTNAAIRKELWESRHRMASLRLELQRGDEAYAALAATLAAERLDHDAGAIELARVTAELHDAVAARAGAEAAHDAVAQAHRAQIAAHAETADALALAVAAQAAHQDAGRTAEARVQELIAEREALLATRTFRWTRRARRIWGWALTRTRR